MFIIGGFVRAVYLVENNCLLHLGEQAIIAVRMA